MGLSRGCGSAGSVLRSQGTLGQEERSRCRARGDQGVDVPMLAPARSRCRRCVRGGWLSAGLLGSDAWVYALLMG